MPRCTSCNKFTAKGTDTEPEIEVEVDDSGMVTGTCRIVNTCEDCGEELEETTFDVEVDMTDAFAKHVKKHKKKEETHDLEVEVENEGRTDRMQDKDRNGRPIRSMRYRRRYYGAECDIRVTCSCGETIDVQSWSDETTAGSMESLV